MVSLSMGPRLGRSSGRGTACTPAKAQPRMRLAAMDRATKRSLHSVGNRMPPPSSELHATVSLIKTSGPRYSISRDEVLFHFWVRSFVLVLRLLIFTHDQLYCPNTQISRDDALPLHFTGLPQDPNHDFTTYPSTLHPPPPPFAPPPPNCNRHLQRLRGRA